LSIVLLAEGDTEAALGEHLKAFLRLRADHETRPNIRLVTRARIENNAQRLREQVARELDDARVIGVIALVDVFPRFGNAAEAKAWLRTATGNPARFHAHVAQHDVEAWLLPYWDDICRRVNVQRRRPGAHPEQVNSQQPPAYRLQELYRLARPKPRKYSKPIEMRELLRGKDLTLSAAACPEFKALLNTLLTLSGLTPLP